MVSAVLSFSANQRFMKINDVEVVVVAITNLWQPSTFGETHLFVEHKAIGAIGGGCEK